MTIRTQGFINRVFAALMVAIFVATPLSVFAARTVLSAKVNNGTTVSVYGGGAVSVTANVQTTGTGNAPHWQSTGWRIAASSGAMTCVNTPAHLTAGSYTETFSATAPAAAGTYNLYVTAYSGTNCTNESGAGTNPTFTLGSSVTVMPSTITITTTTLTNGTVGSAYTAPLTASTTGTVGTITWSRSAGTLPPGLALTPTTGTAIALAGTPTTAGTYTFTLKATSGSISATKGFTVVIAAGTPTINLTPTTLGSATVGTAFNQTLTANTTAVGPFTWSIASGSLPAGLTLGANTGTTNTISGTPTASSSASFAIKVTNGVSSTTQNYTLTVADAPAPGQNLVQNGSLETASGTLPAGWQQGGWGTNTATFTYPVAGKTGNGAKVAITAYTNGDAKWFFTDVAVTPGATYTFSDAYNSTIASSLVAQYTLSGGTLSYVDIASLPSSNGSWATASYQMIAPANAVSVTVFHLIAGVGSLTIDDVSVSGSAPQAPTITLTPGTLANGVQSSAYTQTLTANTTAVGPFTWSIASGSLPAGLTLSSNTGTTNTISGTPSVAGTFTFGITVTNGTSSTTQNYSITLSAPNTSGNLILNPSLETVSGTTPANWQSSSWGTNNATFTYPVAGKTGNGVKVAMTSYTSGDAKWFFNDVAVTPGATYTFADAYNSTIASQIVAQYTLTGGTVSYEQLAAPLSTGGAWQNASVQFVAPATAVSVTIFHLIAGVGSLTTDDYSLTQTGAPGSNVFPKGLVTLTFDDGWQSQYTNGIPILSASGLKSTFYIINDAMINSASDPSYMNSQTVLALQNTYGNEIGAHTMDHCDMVLLYNNPNSATGNGCPDNHLSAPSTAQYQIAQSRAGLQALTGSAVDSFAYPYGSGTGNSGVEGLVNTSGYGSGRGVVSGYNTKTTDKFALQVQNVDASVTNFNATVKPWIDYAAANKVWLILMFHQVETSQATLTQNGETDGTTTGMLQSITDYLKAQQTAGTITVDTMHNVMTNYMGN